MADEAELVRRRSENEIRRSRVRQMVTYVVIYTYLGLAVAVTLWLMWAGRYEVAIGVLAGVAGLAGSITGFWFGSRRPSSPPDGTASSTGGTGGTR